MITETRLKFYVSEESIFRYYFGEFEIGKKYNSPLRRDPRPSFMINVHEGRLYWKDFGLTSDVSADAIGFVAELNNETRKAAVRRIWHDFMHNKPNLTKKADKSLNIGLPYDLVTHDLTSFELRYWEQHCIEQPLLDRFNIKGVESLSRHGKLMWRSTAFEPAYAYMFDRDTFKIYRPKSEDKFRGQNNGSVIEGYAQLPATGDCLIITSSMKDTLVLTSLGYAAAAPSGETNIRALFERAREFNARFSNVVILFDNDSPGIRAATRVSHATNWRKIFLPRELAKDPADVVKKFGNRFVLSQILARFVP